MSLSGQIIARVRAGERPTDISRALNCARGTVYDYIWKARVAGEKLPQFPRGRQVGSMTVCIPPHLRRALAPFAEARACEPNDLAFRILECVVQAGLIDAVLDDIDPEDAP